MGQVGTMAYLDFVFFNGLWWHTSRCVIPHAESTVLMKKQSGGDVIGENSGDAASGTETSNEPGRDAVDGPFLGKFPLEVVEIQETLACLGDSHHLQR